jgi:hypothetical protein
MSILFIEKNKIKKKTVHYHFNYQRNVKSHIN